MMPATVRETPDGAPIPLGLTGRFGQALRLSGSGVLVGLDHSPEVTTFRAADVAVFWAPTDHYARQVLLAPATAKS